MNPSTPAVPPPPWPRSSARVLRPSVLPFLASLVLAMPFLAEAQPSRPPPLDCQVEKWMKESDFVFVGSPSQTTLRPSQPPSGHEERLEWLQRFRFERVPKGNPSEDESDQDGTGASGFTANELLLGAAPLLGFQGEQVYLVADPANPDNATALARLQASTSQSLVFTAVDTVGEELILRYVAHRSLGTTPLPAELRSQIKTHALRQRLIAADIVISGTVLKTQPETRSTKGREREHEPDYMLATVAVREVLDPQGGAVRPNVQIRFPRSRDIAWADFPKPAKDQYAIWLLKLVEQGQNVFTLNDPLDVQLLASKSDISKLLQQTWTTSCPAP